MGKTNARNSGVMHFSAGHLSSCKQSAENEPVAAGFAQKHKTWRGEQSRDLLQCAGQIRWRPVDLGVGGDGEELVDTWPRNRPSGRTLDQQAQRLPCWLEPRR